MFRRLYITKRPQMLHDTISTGKRKILLKFTSNNNRLIQSTKRYQELQLYDLMFDRPGPTSVFQTPKSFSLPLYHEMTSNHNKISPRLPQTKRIQRKKTRNNKKKGKQRTRRNESRQDWCWPVPPWSISNVGSLDKEIKHDGGTKGVAWTATRANPKGLLYTVEAGGTEPGLMNASRFALTIDVRWMLDLSCGTGWLPERSRQAMNRPRTISGLCGLLRIWSGGTHYINPKIFTFN